VTVGVAPALAALIGAIGQNLQEISASRTAPPQS
jgi:hypothetical protein